MNYYDVLQVVATASPEEIRASYLRLVQQYHPDRHVGEADAEGERDRFKQIQEAYEVLHDADRRAEYDRGRPIPSRRPGVRRTENRQAAQTTHATSRGRRRDVPNEWVHRNLPRRRKGRLFRRTVFVVCVVGLAVAVIPSCGHFFESVGGISNFRFPVLRTERNEPKSTTPTGGASVSLELAVKAMTEVTLGDFQVVPTEEGVLEESHGEEIERIIVESVDFEVAPANYADEAPLSTEEPSVSVNARRLQSLEMARQLKTHNQAHEALAPMRPDLLLEAGDILLAPFQPNRDFGPHMSLPVAESSDAGSSLLASGAANQADSGVRMRPSISQDETLLLTPLQHEALEAVKTRELVGSRAEPNVGGPFGDGLGRTTAIPAPIPDWKVPLHPVQNGLWKPDVRFAPSPSHLIDPDLQTFPVGPRPVSTGLHSQIAPGYQKNLATEFPPR